MVTALAFIASVVAYAGIAGWSYAMIYAQFQRNCRNCSHVPIPRECYSEHESGAFFTGILWPISLPLLVGMSVARHEPKAIRSARRIKEMEKEIGL